jgi:polygalacturonase
MIYCHNVDLQDIFVNNTGNVVSSCKNRNPALCMVLTCCTPQVNNDGADTIRSSHINFRRWTVYNGDDCISLKGNSTDIGIYDSECHDGSGIALGSIGQFHDQFETMERLTVENVYFKNTLHAVSTQPSLT